MATDVRRSGLRLVVTTAAFLVVGLVAGLGAQTLVQWHTGNVMDVAQRSAFTILGEQVDATVAGDGALVAATLDGAGGAVHDKAGQQVSTNGCYVYWGSQTCSVGETMYAGHIVMHGIDGSHGGTAQMCWDDRLRPWESFGDHYNAQWIFMRMNDQASTGQYTSHLSNYGSRAWNYTQCAVCCGK